MSHSDDPPFLTIGTEVSAKYRGAFCEATIKVAKKLVKCKVSYSKGQMTMVSSDVIKGPLKVGLQVDVRQPDGQYQPATVHKLTDQSTYTVVFDDGDERTLKRSSLCLKGARHFHESESLDNTPLTDPENFGTPVVQSSKKTRNNKRRRLSHSPTREEEATKRKCCYPPEFPVGKVVFLENDRRRSCWLPAVIVPAHYVMEEEDMTPDTICIRSFKDGRFFASTKDELHDFSPDKEPLSSMLDGEIQAMYMCKPAIEKAMVYLDTGGLPWDMELFTFKTSEVVPATQTPHRTPEKMESEEDSTAEMNAFMDKLKKFLESKGTPLTRQPTLSQKDLNLFKLYQLVKENGGMDQVTQWRSLYLQLGMPPMSNASYTIKQAYKKYLLDFELSEKAKPKPLPSPVARPSPVAKPSLVAKPSPVARTSPGRPNRRRPVSQETDEEHDKSNKQQEKPEKPERVEKPEKVEKKVEKPKVYKAGKFEKPESVERPRKVEKPDKAEKPEKFEKPEKIEKPEKVEKPAKITRQASKDSSLREPMKDAHVAKQDEEEGNKKLETVINNDAKSEISDHDSSQADSGSSNGDEVEDHKLERRGLERCAGGYLENDRILVWYGKGKTLRTYEAKILGVEETESRRDYLVHYNGWNMRYDEWIEEHRIAGRPTSPSKGPTRPFTKKKHKKSRWPPSPIDESIGAKGKERRENKKTPQSSAGNPPPPSSSASTPDGSASENGSTSSISSNGSKNGKVGQATRGPGRPPKRRKSSGPTEGSGNESPSSPSSKPTLPEPSSTATPASRKPLPLSPKTETPSLLSPPPTSNSEPSRTDVAQNGEMELDEAIEVKREENLSWSLRGTDAADPLVCSERLPGTLKLNIKEDPDQRSPSSPSKSRYEDSSSSPLVSPKHLPTPSLKSPDQPCPRSSPPASPDAHSNNDSDLSNSPTHTSSGGLEDGDGEEGMEVDEKSSDEKSSRSDSPHCEQQSHCKGTPEGKRRLREFETEEEYEERKRARRTNMNYVINFSQLPEMTSGERVALIQQRIRDVQKRWTELKIEVAHLDRKRRRARRKEREAARSHANQPFATITTTPQQQQSPAIECH